MQGKDAEGNATANAPMEDSSRVSAGTANGFTVDEAPDECCVAGGISGQDGGKTALDHVPAGDAEQFVLVVSARTGEGPEIVGHFLDFGLRRRWICRFEDIRPGAPGNVFEAKGSDAAVRLFTGHKLLPICLDDVKPRLNPAETSLRRRLLRRFRAFRKNVPNQPLFNLRHVLFEERLCRVCR